MKLWMKLLPLLAVLLATGSCDGTNIFYGNAFSDLDQPTFDDNLSHESAGSLIDLANDWGDHFYDAIDSQSEFNAVTTTLNDVLTDPAASNSDKQDAAIVLTNVYLYTSGANDSLDNASQNISELQSIDLSDPVALSDYMFGANATAAQIAPQLLGMSGCYDALTAYGNTLDTTTPPVGADTNLLAMQAVTAGVMTKLLASTMVVMGQTEAEAAVTLATYLADQSIPVPYNPGVLVFMDYSGVDAATMEASLDSNFNTGISNVIMGSTVADLLRQ